MRRRKYDIEEYDSVWNVMDNPKDWVYVYSHSICASYADILHAPLNTIVENPRYDKIYLAWLDKDEYEDEKGAAGW